MDVAEIILAVGSLIGAVGGVYSIWTKYNQEAKNKKTEYEIEKLRNEDKVNNQRRADNSAIVFGELWNVLYETGADRVYIAQPHPLGHEEMLSIYFEVKQKGVEAMKPNIQGLKISEVAKFASCLAEDVFMYVTDIENQIVDRYAKSIFGSNGCQSVIIKRLSDNRHDWIGNIFCEFTTPMPIDEAEAREVLHTAATNIQYILPKIE